MKVSLKCNIKSVIGKFNIKFGNFCPYLGKTEMDDQPQICPRKIPVLFTFFQNLYFWSHEVVEVKVFKHAEEIYMKINNNKMKRMTNKRRAGCWKFHFNPIALRKAKIVCNFGLSECSRVHL